MHTLLEKIRLKALDSCLRFTSSRSSGPGGQNVNKVNSRVSLHFELEACPLLEEPEKAFLAKKLSKILDQKGVLHLHAQEKRSQLENKQVCIKKFYALLRKVSTPKPIRKATKPAKGAIEKRLQDKKQHAQKKQWRQERWD
ncbi:class I peptide chain release factor [Nitritalea halalkaliphila LW7]|uniref:Class I peptide chain release factor n=1 Tax=Nitritalea halalkaliphila LW7 TaxID=1189621 RepID=I5C858_9BACT|nr:alternative ribosome rescue aminoacyl-tRNA hydrolase ArfB [Nitritalea halalkaliphila]EIM78010.1 class I peptide chain release factor [Nitritalea halalkaliphila LW7]